MPDTRQRRRKGVPVAMLAAFALAGVAAAGDWNLFRGDAQQTGVSSESLPADLKPLWVFEAEDGIEAAPAVHDGVVYAIGGRKNTAIR